MSGDRLFGGPVMGRREFETVMVERLWSAWEQANGAYARLPGGSSGEYRERLAEYGHKLSAFEALASLVGAYLGINGSTVAMACRQCTHGGAVVAALDEARETGDE